MARIKDGLTAQDSAQRRAIFPGRAAWPAGGADGARLPVFRGGASLKALPLVNDYWHLRICG